MSDEKNNNYNLGQFLDELIDDINRLKEKLMRAETILRLNKINWKKEKEKSK